MAGCCCGNDEPGCGGVCAYLAVGGSWVRMSDSCLSPCVCFAPTITPEFEGQEAGCSCYSADAPPVDPHCTYSVG